MHTTDTIFIWWLTESFILPRLFVCTASSTFSFDQLVNFAQGYANYRTHHYLVIFLTCMRIDDFQFVNT